MPRLRVTNAADCEARVYVEPWGFDFAVAPTHWLEFEAEGATPDFRFELTVDGDDRHHRGASSFGVHHEGRCEAIVCRLPDGSVERFQ